jgi:hypothetical protein
MQLAAPPSRMNPFHERYKYLYSQNCDARQKKYALD